MAKRTETTVTTKQLKCLACSGSGVQIIHNSFGSLFSSRSTTSTSCLACFGQGITTQVTTKTIEYLEATEYAKHGK